MPDADADQAARAAPADRQSQPRLVARPAHADDDCAEPAAATRPSDETLVLTARRDPRAIARLYERYADPLYRYALARSAAPAVADDVVSETFVAVLETLERFDPLRGSFAAWLFTIAGRRLSDHARRERRFWRAISRRWSPPALAEDDTLETLVRREDADRLRAALARLPDDERELLRLRYAAGLTSVTYDWDANSLAFTLSGTLGAGIDEALLERFVNAMPSAPPPAWTGQLYAFRDGDVAVIDSQTGAVTRTLGAQIGSQSPALAIDTDSRRIAVADFLRDTETPSFGVMIYRMSDGSLEHEIATGLLAQSFGPSAGIALTPGGQYLVVYQHEIPPDGNGDNARYWLGVWDLNTGEHVRDVPLASCHALTQIVAPTPERLYLLCGDYRQVVDLTHGAVVDSFGPNAGDAAILIRDG